MGGTVSGTAGIAAADTHISCKTGKQNGTPGALLTVSIALGTVSLNQSGRPGCGVADGQAPDGSSWNAGDFFSPLRCLGNAVMFAQEIGAAFWDGSAPSGMWALSKPRQQLSRNA